MQYAIDRLIDRIAELEAENERLKTAATEPLQIDWSKAPEWAQWAAADQSGETCYYEFEPECTSNTSMWMRTNGSFEHVLVYENWRKTLTKRPDNQ